MASPMPDVEPVTTTDFPLSMAEDLMVSSGGCDLIYSIVAALLHRNIAILACFTTAACSASPEGAARNGIGI